MYKLFKQKYQNKYYEIRLFNLETGAFVHYMQDIQFGFCFNHYATTVYDMGYKSVKDCIKELKRRGLLRIEVTLEFQAHSEEIGIAKLKKEQLRIQNLIDNNDFILS